MKSYMAYCGKQALYFAYVLAAVVLGCRILIGIAPWRTAEIVIMGAVTLVVSAAVWRVLRHARLARTLVFASAAALPATIVIVAGLTGYRAALLDVSLQGFATSALAVTAIAALVAAGLAQRHAPTVRTSMLVFSALLAVALLHEHQRIWQAVVDRNMPALDGLVDRTTLEKFRSGTEGHANAATQLFKILAVPREHESVLDMAGSIMESRYQFLGYDPVKLPQDLTWTETAYGDRSWNFSLHKMDHVAVLTRAFQLTDNDAYLQRAEDHVFDWIHDNTRYFFDAPSKFTWHDHATAFRLENWLFFYGLWTRSALATAPERETLLRAMLGHGIRLANNEFYTSNHNHGVDQDRALFAFAALHPGVGPTAQWQALARRRLRAQMDFAISPSGIHLEHSPAYHLFSMHQLAKMLKVLTIREADGPLEMHIRNMLERMATFVRHVVQPDGTLAQIGDTGDVSITRSADLLVPFGYRLPRLKTLAMTGRDDEIVDETVCFTEEGYAVIRDTADGKLDYAHSFYLFFTAGAHAGRAHRQADDLSFVLAYLGQPMIVDPGFYSYKFDAGRDYVKSTAAHNTVVVDSGSQNGFDTKLELCGASGLGSVIRASHRNYPGIAHRRWIVHLRPDVIVIVDRLRPTQPDGSDHRFEQVLHFAPGLLVTSDGAGGAMVVNPDNPSISLRVLQLGDRQPAARVVAGQELPMQGWFSQTRGTLIPAPTLIATLQGPDAEFVTLLAFRDAVVRLDGETLNVRWTVDGLRQSAAINLANGDVVTE